jgi:hypothetical protein
MNVQVSIGEAFDKLSILTIKLERITDENKLENVRKEFNYLDYELKRLYKPIFYSPHYEELIGTNKALWDVEDVLRDHEKRGDFGEVFIAKARQVYKYNDYRAELKKRINQGYESEFIEEKSYNQY